MFNTLEAIALAAAETARPPERLTVSEAAAKKRNVNVPGAYVGPWLHDMTPYLVEPMDLLTSTAYTGMVFCGPAQSGKPLDIETPVATPAGWSRLGDLKAGDTVFSHTGEAVSVLYATPVMIDHNCYVVTFDDGSALKVDGEHRWSVNDMWAADPLGHHVVTTEFMLSRYRVPTKNGARYRFSIPAAQPLRLPRIELPVEPYLLGLWLAEGKTGTSSLTLNPGDAPHVMAQILRHTVFYEGKGNSTGTADRLHVPGLIHDLRHAGISDGQKSLPAAYLRASIPQRRALLHGLMDGDGSMERGGRASWSSSLPALADAVYELLVSLGFKVFRDDKIPTFQNGEGDRSYRLNFTPADAREVFSLPRHIARADEHARRVTKRPTHAGRRFIRSIEPVDSVPVRCIHVDAPDHLFLAGRSLIATHNTDMFINWLLQSVLYDPNDMMVVSPDQNFARDFSIRRVDRLHRFNPEVAERLIQRRDADNTFDKKYQSGMFLTLGWPTINQLSGRPIPRLWLTDYDRMELDVAGEGEPFDLARKRATTFRRNGMCAAESSPGFTLDSPKWIEKVPHEAPPTQGILKLYNRGDRRRWYWKCVNPKCRMAFEPDFSNLVYPKSDDIREAAEAAVMACPSCHTEYRYDGSNGLPGKHELNRAGKWIKSGEFWLPDNRVVGKPQRSDIGSFWVKGPAAFPTWAELVEKYLTAEKEYRDSGSEGALKTTVQTDQALPYTPKSQLDARLPEALKARAKDYGGSKEAPVVPQGVRFLIACIDVQKHRFEVQIHGIGVGGDIWIVDRFHIHKSRRLDADGERHWLNPGAYLEDWKLIVPNVLQKTYPLADGSGRHMPIKLTMCDSGGREGVTSNAYNFVRWLRDGREFELPDGSKAPQEEGTYDWVPGLFPRFQLLRGDPTPNAPRVRRTFPDSQRKDRHAGARGEIPVLQLNTNMIKDTVDKMLDRTEVRGGRVNFAGWLEDWWYVELTVETRDPAKGWLNPKNQRNESWDLLVYAVAAGLTPQTNYERMDWNNPPGWAADWDANDLVFNPDREDKPFESKSKSSYDLSALAAQLA